MGYEEMKKAGKASNKPQAQNMPMLTSPPRVFNPSAPPPRRIGGIMYMESMYQWDDNDNIIGKWIDDKWVPYEVPWIDPIPPDRLNPRVSAPRQPN